MQSHYGRDTANLRHAKLNANGVQIRVAEEQSIDSETYHVFETLGFVAISNIDLEGDAVVEPTEEPVATVITLEVNASKIRGKRTAELYWSGAGGDSVQITRISENNEVFTVTVPIENYYKEILGKRGTYTYQVCATEGSVCSDVITVEL